MLLQTNTTPTGRRKITLRMLSARAARPEQYEPTKPGLVLSAFKRAADVLGCSGKAVHYVDVLIGFTRPSDWARGGLIACWPSAALLSETLNVGPSRLKELSRELQELGLVEIHDSPTGKRFGRRNADGIVTSFSGFDLSPLACRLPEFQRIASERHASWLLGGELRAKVSVLRKTILSLADTGQAEEIDADWLAIVSETRRIAALKGRSYDPVLLAPIAEELARLQEAVVELLAVNQTVDTHPVGAEKRPLTTTTNHLPIAKANTNITPPTKLDHTQVAVRDKREEARTSVLRGFVVSPSLIVQIAPAFSRSLSAAPTFPNLIDASQAVRSELGISPDAWGQACVILGRLEAMVMLATISARFDAGEVSSPGGLLRRMIELHQSGELHLDRTLFGLAERRRETTH